MSADNIGNMAADLATQPELLHGMLIGMGLARPDAVVRVEQLSGGVSSSILRVTVDGAGQCCVKQALPKLKVAKDWRVPVDRVFAEIAWLRQASAIAPGQVPRVLGVDEALGAFAMEFLDAEQHPNWKARLLAGDVDAAAMRGAGTLLGRIHAATADDAGVAMRFANQGNFFALRLEPYLLEAAHQHNDLARELVALVHTTQQNARVLVHGDVSPKNMLLAPDGAAGPVLLDAECAVHGDPAFDAAFLLNHLLLKCLAVPARRQALLQGFGAVLDAYLAQVRWEPADALAARIAALLPGLLLARVDGKSPVEYLDEAQRALVRGFAREALQRAPADAEPAALLARWDAALG